MCEDVSEKENVVYKQVDIWDSADQNIKQYFPECLEYIDNSIREGGTVLVHCMAGISRSATIVIAYLMSKNCMTFIDALKFA